MNRSFTLIAFLFLLCTGLKAQISTRGKDFWVGYMTHSNGINPPSSFDAPPPCEMRLYITASHSTNGVVHIPGLNVNIPFTVGGDLITSVKIPQGAYINEDGKVLPRGINVRAEKEVAVYAHIYSRNRSAASLILPESALGRKYYVMSYTQRPASDVTFMGYLVKYRSQVLVLAVEDHTTVSIVPNSSSGLPPRQIILNKGQVYELQSHTDLTGTLIESVSTGNEPCKKIAVFSGSSGLQLYKGCTSGQDGFDNLFQQLSPVTSWGKEFVLVPFTARNTGGDIFRVLAAEPNTVVRAGNLTYTIAGAGEFAEFDRSDAVFVTSDKPVSVAQYQRGQDCDHGTGDPEMVVVNPLEQTFDNVTFLSSPNFAILNHYLNVVIKSSGVAGFRIDGEQPPVAFRPVPGRPGYSYLQTPVSPGSHTLTADSGFTAMAYGMGDYESYAYTAGGNIKNLQQQLIREPFNVQICQRDPRDFEVVLPFPARRITWLFKETDSPVIDERPVNIASEPGKFMYAYPQNPIEFSDAGTSELVLAIEPEGSCDPPEQLTYKFEVLPAPVLATPVIPPVCQDTGAIDLRQYVSLQGGTFAGTGINGDLFYPVEAGIGQHTINYRFTNTSGCTSTVEFILEVRNLLSLDAGPDQVIRLGEAVPMKPAVSGNGLSYQWQPPDGLSDPFVADPVASPLQNTSYELTITAPSGCTLKDTVKFTVLSGISAPNTFTPNYDGVNDKWEITGIENYPDCEINVYNRFGEKVYYSRGYSISWDGRKKGVSLPAGTYYYVIYPRSQNLRPFSGSVTLLY